MIHNTSWPYANETGITEKLNCDVLVLGGGLAGCYAAIAAARRGQSVILVEKGAVERFEPKFRCRALISKKDAQEYETEELIDRMFEGSKKNFFAAMLSENSLTAEELEQLKDMVNQMK